MIGVDTNVLVRFLTADEPGQYRTVLAFFEDRSPAEPAFVSAVTLAETVWVLRHKYGLGSAEISESVRMILHSQDFVVEGATELEPIQREAASPSRFADFLIAHLGAAAGCSRTVTFDRRAAKSIPSMELLA